ncbi:hypothetical protein POTOM_051066 [Populus tomentosa]|uniref:Uncharacterized protein n=1 Tax=Populus tomentosa TaxID=118781 RepID=A0A8X8C9W7_POPTO|nr:hypothetical protein POTOM_051066 [Populus tomentosa]
MVPAIDPTPPQAMPKPNTKTTNPKPKSDGTHNSWADKVRVSDSSTRFTLEPLPRQPVGSDKDKGKNKAHEDSPAVPIQLQPECQPTVPSTSTKIVTHSPADEPPIAMIPTQPSPQPQATPLPDPNILPANPKEIDDCDSSQDSGNEFLDLQHHHLTTMHASLCLESKMDSLRTVSANSSAAQDVSAEASSSFNPPTIQSPSPSPTTVRKKKGRKKKEARGL